MDSIANASGFLAAMTLGLMAGALVAEGTILVPFWRSLPPAEFLHWYKRYAALLQGFFGPLEVGATVLTIAATAANWIGSAEKRYWLSASAVLCIAVLAVFPIYFQNANNSFRTGTIATDCVQRELRRWSRWHWGRTVLAIAAFSASVVAIAA